MQLAARVRAQETCSITSESLRQSGGNQQKNVMQHPRHKANLILNKQIASSEGELSPLYQPKMKPDYEPTQRAREVEWIQELTSSPWQDFRELF